MRIISGEFRGRTLEAPRGEEIRPTSDRVREALFNVLAHGLADWTLTGARVLDVFAGTGALGLEALSRGAKFCQFIDESADARGLVRTNADKLGAIGRCKIWRRDATDMGRCAPLPPFDLVFVDPPYGRGLGAKAMTSLVSGGWLSSNPIVVFEESVETPVIVPKGLVERDQRCWGDTRVCFYGLTPVQTQSK